jgi:hypothetical protein
MSQTVTKKNRYSPNGESRNNKRNQPRNTSTLLMTGLEAVTIPPPITYIPEPIDETVSKRRRPPAASIPESFELTKENHYGYPLAGPQGHLLPMTYSPFALRETASGEYILVTELPKIEPGSYIPAIRNPSLDRYLSPY